MKSRYMVKFILNVENSLGNDYFVSGNTEPLGDWSSEESCKLKYTVNDGKVKFISELIPVENFE